MQDPRINFLKIVIAERLGRLTLWQIEKILESIKTQGTDIEVVSNHLHNLSEIYSIQSHLIECLAEFETDDYHDFEFFASTYEGMIFGYQSN